jgi:hypothetical protein
VGVAAGFGRRGGEPVTGRERRAQSASICPGCCGPIAKGDPVHAWRESLYTDAHAWCYEKDREPSRDDATGTVGAAVTG